MSWLRDLLWRWIFLSCTTTNIGRFKMTSWMFLDRFFNKLTTRLHRFSGWIHMITLIHFFFAGVSFHCSKVNVLRAEICCKAQETPASMVGQWHECIFLIIFEAWKNMFFQMMLKVNKFDKGLKTPTPFSGFWQMMLKRGHGSMMISPHPSEIQKFSDLPWCSQFNRDLLDFHRIKGLFGCLELWKHNHTCMLGPCHEEVSNSD